MAGSPFAVFGSVQVTVASTVGARREINVTWTDNLSSIGHSTPSILDVGTITDPEALLDHARELEPWNHYAERKITLDRLQELLEGADVPPAPAGRDWRLELLAERAVDGTRENAPDGRALVDQVLEEAAPSLALARGRALLAGGQQLAWVGTDAATAKSRREFGEAAAIFETLGRREWQGSALLRCGYSAHYQYGDLVGAETMMSRALDAFGPGQRRDGALVHYADVLIDLGEFDRAEPILAEAGVAAERRDDRRSIPEVIWSRARVAAGRGDARATERLLREAEQAAVETEWFEGHVGSWFLLESAELLDRVGLTQEAHRALERALEHARTYTSVDNEVVQTRTMLLARSGDPLQALESLQQIVRGKWLEKRLVWRHTLMASWATFRAGREGAAPLAAQALEQAAMAGGGGARVAVAGERDLTAALAPLAETAGSTIGRELLLGGRQLLVRLFGTPSVTRSDGSAIELPVGKPGELVRILALNPRGLPVEVVLEWFFPGAAPATARQRLRQILTRLRAAAGEVVVRDGDSLRLVPAWIDVSEFLTVADRVRSARGSRAVQLAYAALVLRTGPLLPDDQYAEWAQDARDRVDARHLELLDLIADDAATRNSHQEALTALEAALVEDPADVSRQQAIIEQLRALGRHQAADHRARRFSEQR
jgi:DNA-binding SARP family transcriptional activator